MSKMKELSKALLQSGEVKLVIGYGEGSNGRVRPVFIRHEEYTNQLLYDNRCRQNLAVYLYKKEISRFGKPAIIANIHSLRGIVRLVVEKQIKEGDFIVLYIDDKEGVVRFNTMAEIENYLGTADLSLKEEDKVLISKLEKMSSSERWTFWQNEMEKCIRCYACRQACPLCYCTQCTVEINQPQWIPVASNALGNLEWHIMRAMHLSGRCVECGQCGDACPVNIPIHLLPIKLAQEIKKGFGTQAGISVAEGCEMSTYQPNDKENFIG